MKSPDAGELDPRLMRAALETPPPPPSAEMLKQVGEMKKVRTRSRFAAFVAALVLGAAWPAYTMIHFPWRRDLGALPPLWVAIGATLWAVGFVASLAAALVPARGDVLPSANRASRISLVAMGVLVMFTAVWTAFAPGVSLRPEDIGRTLWQSCLGCGRYVLQVAGIYVVLGFLLLRRILPMGGRRMGLALGAAGGALAGLALHFLCPIATMSHVLLSHVGTMILASLAGSLILRGLLGR